MRRFADSGRALGLRLWIGCLVMGLAAAAQGAEIVRFETVLGDIDVRLFETATPASVANFLNYVTDGDFDESFIHRAPTNFVLQGGGFRWPEADAGNTSVPTDAPVVNEPGLSNLRGTIAYAKQGGNPNSATSGWFFNLADRNAAEPFGPELDTQNGGFTVFGRVIGDGFAVMDAIADLQVINAGGAFTTLPVLDTFESPTVFREDLVFIETVSQLTFEDGDYDFDGDVDQADLSVWEDQFGSSLRIVDQPGIPSTTMMEADGNGDGVVDAADYTVWRDAFSASTAQGIPEPTAAVLISIASLAVATHRRHSA